MTIKDILIACGSGEMPRVRSRHLVNKASTTEGIVTQIKANRNWRGIAVNFAGVGYDTWFHEKHEEDRRSHYMSELELIN